MKILVDMNLSPRWCGLLNDQGFEAVHWSSLGACDTPDVKIMEWAREAEYVVLTHDLDFGAILAATQGEKPSVVQIRTDDVRPDVIGEAVVSALRAATGELQRGALVVVDTARSRVRLLPLLRP